MAEEIIFTDITTGAGNDIERVTKMARKMVCEWGMSEKIGPQTVGETQQEVFLGREWTQNSAVSAEMARLVDSEIKGLVDEARERCRTLLTENIDALHAIASALLERETISGDEIDILMRGEKLPPFQTDDAKDEFKLEPADGPENTEAAQSPDSAAAPAESEKEDAQTEQEAPEAQGETPAEPKKPANGSFSGRWDSFSAPSDRKDDK